MAASLEITGLVRKPATLDFQALAKLPGQVPDIGKLIPGRHGGGVRLESVLANAGTKPGAAYITLEAADGFAASVALEAIRGQGLVVYRKGAAPLTVGEGGPVRFYIIDVESCGVADIDECANVKSIVRIKLSATPGHDNRPTTQRAHTDLHEREKKRG